MTALRLSGNLIEGFPKDIGLLQKLKLLELANNHILFLPNEIGALSQLEKLDIRYNQLKHLPVEMVGRKSSFMCRVLFFNIIFITPTNAGQVIKKIAGVK